MRSGLINNLILWFKEPFIQSRQTHAPDYTLLITIGIILFFGLLILSSATTVIAFQEYDGDSYYFFKHQLLYGLIPGIILFLFALRTPYFAWKKVAFWMLLISIGLLVLVLIPGIGESYGTGANRWITIAGFGFQPGTDFQAGLPDPYYRRIGRPGGQPSPRAPEPARRVTRLPGAPERHILR